MVALEGMGLTQRVPLIHEVPFIIIIFFLECGVFKFGLVEAATGHFPTPSPGQACTFYLQGWIRENHLLTRDKMRQLQEEASPEERKQNSPAENSTKDKGVSDNI